MAIIVRRPPAPKYIYSPPTLDIMRKRLYEEGDGILSLKPTLYKGEYTPLIMELLDEMFKLTVLAKTMQKYDNKDRLSHVQPYFDDKQQFRCYLSDSYIVVEVSHNPKDYSGSGNWMHIIENHGADEKGQKRYKEFSIIPGLEDEHIENIIVGIKCVVETVEHHVFKLMNNTQTTFEKVKMIRIGDKTEAERVEEEKIKIRAEREVVAEEKQQKRKEFWNKIFGGSKISF
jgi:hypothetical protein